MLKVVFLKNKRAPSSMKNICYLVAQTNYTIAVSIAKEAFKNEHDYRYYDRVLITEPRVLEG
jgi:hypothetical protein